MEKDEKMRGWSLFVDEKGFIHLVGGQHNTPNGDLYIPGSWEKTEFITENEEAKLIPGRCIGYPENLKASKPLNLPVGGKDPTSYPYRLFELYGVSEKL
jgi:hypothetical protein